MWFHVDLAKLCDATAQLEKTLDAFQDAHVRKSDLFNKLQFGVLRQCGNGLGDSKHGADNVV